MNANQINISDAISEWHRHANSGHVFEIEDGSVSKALSIVRRFTITCESDTLIYLCSLNLLNAAIKTLKFKNTLSYAVIKSNAAKLVGIIDALKMNTVGYYYSKDERCLYFQIQKVIFSFHEVPQTPEILKASFAKPIVWSGLRLQKIAQPLFDKVVSDQVQTLENPLSLSKNACVGKSQKKSECSERLVNDMVENKNPLKSNIEKIITEVYNSLPSLPGWYRNLELLKRQVISRLHSFGIDIDEGEIDTWLNRMGAFIKTDYVDKLKNERCPVIKLQSKSPGSISDLEKKEVRQIVMSIIENTTLVTDSDGWYDFVPLAKKLRDQGLKKENYGHAKTKLLPFLEMVFDDLIEKRVEGTKAYVKFNFGLETYTQHPNVESIVPSQESNAKDGKDNKSILTKSSSNIDLYKLGYVDKSSWEKISNLSKKDISIHNITEYLSEDPEYLNGAGFSKFPDGTSVTEDTAKYIFLRTELKTESGELIVGWYSKNTRIKQKISFSGIAWGTEDEFKTSKDIAHSYRVGRMLFSDIEACKDFFDTLKSKTIPEPWAYKNIESSEFKYPILKSYLQFELDRLFYEQEVLNLEGKILFNPDKGMILFNTNLINKYGDDLYIVGKKVLFNGNICVSELEVAPSKSRLSKYGYSSNISPNPPQFFKDINEIVFHCSWDIDDDMEKREHIIEERIERFPERYRDLKPEDLGQKLNNAINFATKIAQRNYKFIVPMYYPTKQRIQLLMPIYLDTTYSDHPDFALVLTPCEEAKLYIPETILGLAEVYQDARLIAKPEESWLNPSMIK